MRATLHHCTVAACAFTTVGASCAEAAETTWRPLSFASFEVPSPDPLQVLVWPDVIREANAYVTTQLKRPLNGRNARVTAISSTYSDGSRSVIVSIALSRQCDIRARVLNLPSALPASRSSTAASSSL